MLQDVTILNLIRGLKTLFIDYLKRTCRDHEWGNPFEISANIIKCFRESQLNGEIVLAVDINTVANEVYKYNFPQTCVSNRNIQSLTAKDIEKLDVNTVLMSPPCQPFTRNGKYLDENDPRTNSFIYLVQLLCDLKDIQYILMENVKGFECSTVRNLFINSLKECRFSYQEFLLCPSAVGIPNSRLRYYCIARRSLSKWHFKTKEGFISSLPHANSSQSILEGMLEKDVEDIYFLSEKLLRRANLLDICYKHSQRSCCFTKAYTHYIEGTGSVFTAATEEQVEKCYKIANSFEVGSEKFVEPLKELNLRFFTPREVLRLMSFPKHYEFPSTVTTKQCYRLLGNSVNVKIISELLNILFK